MAQVEVLLPKMGESVAEATITKWLKNVGDSVEAEESLVEIATDKVDSEVPSPADGVIAEIRYQEGDVVQVGDIICVIAGEGESVTPSNGTTTTSDPQPELQPVMEEQVAAAEPVSQPSVATVAAPSGDGAVTTIPKTSDTGKFYSPLVRNIAKTEGISLQELETLPGSGANGRVTKKDILAYVPNRNGLSQPEPIQQKQPSTVAQSAAVSPATSISGDTEILEMGRMRKLIADHMVMSMQTSPHVTSFVEADVTNVVNWRNRAKNEFQQKEGAKLTFTPIFIECIVKAIKDFPMVNVSVDGDNIIKKNYINLGMATALPNGNLIVPVIRNADHLNLVGLTKAVNDLAQRARDNKLQPDEIQGGTYTITNVGSFGNVMGTPIINQPQVAILATGTIQKKPAVIETPEGDTIGIRHMMFLSHSYDHRVVDGALGGQFVRRVADYLEQWDVNRTI